MGDEGEAFIDHGVKVDRFLVQLTTAEHGPMPIDDLRGEDALALDIGQDLPHRVGSRPVGCDHHLQRLGVVHHRTERLSELMSYRGGQRRHRLAATGVGGESQVSPALDLGAPPCAALVQEPDDQERLEIQRADRAENRVLVLAPQARGAIPHDAAGRQPALGDAPPLQLAPIEYRWPGCGAVL